MRRLASTFSGCALKTGIKSLEALHLYWRFGYSKRGPFGTYAPDPLCVFREKQLGRVPAASV